MDASNPPGDWPVPLLIFLFVWNVGRQFGEFFPKHCEIMTRSRVLSATFQTAAAGADAFSREAHGFPKRTKKIIRIEGLLTDQMNRCRWELALALLTQTFVEFAADPSTSAILFAGIFL